MSEVEEQIKAVDKLLKEPVFLGHDTNTKLVSAHLFFVSILAIIYFHLDLKLNTESSFLGLKFNGLQDLNVSYIFLILIVYLSFHFIWLSWNAFAEWRLRVTGTRVTFITGASFRSEFEDKPDNPRQSTLHNYYATSMKKYIPRMETLIDQIDNSDNKDNRISEIQSLIKEIQKSNLRVEASVRRFDKWTMSFHKSQNYEWLLIEFLLPLILASVAIISIWTSWIK